MANKKTLGFTLIELSVALGVAGSIALISSQEAEFERSQDMARSLGNEIYQYNSGVSRYLAANAGDPTIEGVHTGSDWLKDSSCGNAEEAFLPCDALPNNKTIRLGSTPITTITSSPDGSVNARTVWDTINGNDGKPDTSLMGLAALIASGNYISQAKDAASGYQLPTVFCPVTSGESASLTNICLGNQNAIISIANLNTATEPWLRTDHGNTMRHVIEFNPDGNITPQADLQEIENRNNDSWLRQIVNVSRLYNQTGASGSSITIGASQGDSIYSDPFLVSNNLLTGSVIADGDLAIMNDVYANSNAYISGEVIVAGDISSNSNIAADSGTVSGNTIRSIEDVISGRDVISRRLVDPDNSSRYIEPSSRSHIESLTATGDIRASRFYDQDNLSRYIDPNSRSQLNALTINNTGTTALDVAGYVRIRGSASPGGSCLTGTIGRTGNGTILNCVSGRWEEPGGASCRIRFRQRTQGSSTSHSLTNYSNNNNEQCTGWVYASEPYATNWSDRSVHQICITCQ